MKKLLCLIVLLSLLGCASVTKKQLFTDLKIDETTKAEVVQMWGTPDEIAYHSGYTSLWYSVFDPKNGTTETYFLYFHDSNDKLAWFSPNRGMTGSSISINVY